MYNLLVTYTNSQWTKGAYTYSRDRVIAKYGDSEVADKYGELTPTVIADLVTFPTLFIYEEGRDDIAVIGWITKIKPRRNEVRIEFEIDQSLPPLSRDRIMHIADQLDIGKFQFSHTHWSVKDVELLPSLIQAEFIDNELINELPKDSRLIQWGLSKPVSQISVRPSVFRVPVGERDPNLVSVMMPFDASFDGVYEAIQNACTEVELECKRADDIWNEAEVIQDVFSLIYRSRIVICDFTKRNSNVFYEAGISHTLGKPVIPIVQNEDDIPFDLRHIRFVKYLDNKEGRTALTLALSKKLQTVTGQTRRD